MLDITLQTDYTPGKNRKGDMVTADWRFLLPKLELDKVGCFGIPPISTVAVLSKMVAELWIIVSHGRYLRSIEEECIQRGFDNIRTVFFNGTFDLPIASNSLDLAILVSRRYTHRLIKSKQVITKFCNFLSPNGIIYFALGSAIEHSFGMRA